MEMFQDGQFDIGEIEDVSESPGSLSLRPPISRAKPPHLSRELPELQLRTCHSGEMEKLGDAHLEDGDIEDGCQGTIPVFDSDFAQFAWHMCA